MRRLRVLIAPLCLGLLLAPSPAHAQAQQEPSTKFERFTLRKGVVVVREHHTIGQISGEYGRARFEASRAFSPGQRDALFALRVEVVEYGSSARSERSAIGVLDADEVSSLRAALPHLKQMLTTIQASKPAHYTEVEFKGGTVRIGFYVGGASASLFIHAGGPIGGTMAFVPTDKFPALEQLVTESVAKLQTLQGGPR